MPGRRPFCTLSITALWIFLMIWGGTATAAEVPATAFIHANLVPMTMDAVVPGQTVVVRGRRITAVGPDGKTEIPPEATVIDCRNRFLMPGLADMHMHLSRHWQNGDMWPVSPLKLYLANGVTTIRCFGPGGKTGRYGLTWRDEIAGGRLDGPSILSCGRQLRGHFKENPRDIVIRQKKQGFDFIKIYSYVTREEFQTILATSKERNIYTAGHIPFQVGLDGVLAQGMDEIAHIEELLWEFSGLDRKRYFETEAEWMTDVIRTTFHRLRPILRLKRREREQKLKTLAAEVREKLKHRPIPFCTTLFLDEVIVEKLFHPDRFQNRPENRYLPRGYLERFRRGREKHQRQFKGGEAFAPLKYMFDKILLAALKEIDIPLLLSTDAGTGGMGLVPGFSLHDELRVLTENGFTPYEAIAAGTVAASKIVKRMNGRDEFGTIESGKRADLILVKKNPLADVAHARMILGVMAAGRWYDQQAIAGMLEY